MFVVVAYTIAHLSCHVAALHDLWQRGQIIWGMNIRCGENTWGINKRGGITIGEGICVDSIFVDIVFNVWHSFRFVSFRFVSFRFVFVSFRFVSFLCLFICLCTVCRSGTVFPKWTSSAALSRSGFTTTSSPGTIWQ